MKDLRVLVTGVGGDLGQAIIKALRLGRNRITYIGCDMNAECAGRSFVDEFYSVPRADDDGYVATLDRLCIKAGVHAVIPGSEPETFVLSCAGLSSGVPVVSQAGDWVMTYGDKLSCMQALEHAVELSPFADGGDRYAVEQVIAQCGYPLVVKERRSSGGQSVSIAADSETLAILLQQSISPLVQGYIDDGGGEFSVGVFASDDFVQAVAFKRTLGPGGCSWFAETCHDEGVLDYATRVAISSGARGSINVQVRKGKDGIRLLEVNPRFSSLAAARAACGFADVSWSLELALGQLSITGPQSIRDIKFQRFISELVDFGNGMGRIPAWDAGEVNKD
jgi:carbamoyl-phosphate synthase large subunit